MTGVCVCEIEAKLIFVLDRSALLSTCSTGACTPSTELSLCQQTVGVYGVKCECQMSQMIPNPIHDLILVSLNTDTEFVNSKTFFSFIAYRNQYIYLHMVHDVLISLYVQIERENSQKQMYTLNEIQ